MNLPIGARRPQHRRPPACADAFSPHARRLRL